jgi:hypothetical protein
MFPRVSIWCRIMTTTNPPLLEQIKEIRDRYGNDVAHIVEALLSRIAAPSHAKPADDALLTRRQAAQFVTDSGFPLAFSTLSKLCALGDGPPVARWWGRRPLYSLRELKAWAETRSTKPR